MLGTGFRRSHFGIYLFRTNASRHLSSFRVDVDVEQFVYDLPEALIATEPKMPRGSSRLLVHIPGAEKMHIGLQAHIRSRAMSHKGADPSSCFGDFQFRDLENFLPDNAHLIFNESKVFKARLFATVSDQKIEVMFLGAEGSNSTSVYLSQPCEGQLWRCMIRSSDLVLGSKLSCRQDADCPLEIEIVDIHSPWIEEDEVDGIEATVRLCSNNSYAQHVFDTLGNIPLPPYMHREAREDDRVNYQTVFAKDTGSVAAPTAGLHFTPEILDTLEKKGIRNTKVCLHVGAGTFRPITVSNAADHSMHEEQFSVDVKSIKSIVNSLKLERPLVPVGTTSVRVLESLYWLGVGYLADRVTNHLEQWTAYELTANGALPSTIEALEALCEFGSVKQADGKEIVYGSTSVCIVPGYSFKLCDALITNFHQPHSTLMLLVASLMGSTDAIQQFYKHAVTQKYEFLSYGDACLVYNGQANVKISTTPSRAFPDSAIAPEMLKSGTKVLLHSCCAPCSGAMIEQMKSEGHDVTILFYNPNIQPREEYDIRKNENKTFADNIGVPFIDLDYDAENWYQQAKGMEFDPERGRRCTMCFDMRFDRTASYAHAHGFSVITTTNATSRWKDADQVNASGIRAAAKYDGIRWWFRDWQTEEMTNRKYKINAQESFYKQEYCGCAYSLRDSNAYRKKEGIPPIVVAGGGIYSNPLLDSEEESPQVVQEFFKHATSPEQSGIRELRELYRSRRKTERDSKSENNW